MTESIALDHYKKALRLIVDQEDTKTDNEILFHLNSAIELGLEESDEASALIFRSNIYIRSGNYESAKKEIEKALEINRRAEKKLSMLSYADAWISLAKIYELEEDYIETMACRQHLIKELPILYPTEEYLEGRNRFIAESYCEIARILLLQYRNEKATEEALSYLERACSIDTEFPDIYLMLALAYDDENVPKYHNLKKALRYYEQYLVVSAMEPWCTETEIIERREYIKGRIKSILED